MIYDVRKRDDKEIFRKKDGVTTLWKFSFGERFSTRIG